jgi:hypothetical protein
MMTRIDNADMQSVHLSLFAHKQILQVVNWSSAAEPNSNYE